jgi:hypothetical protein
MNGFFTATAGASSTAERRTAETARRRARGECWASLMARTFGFDVLVCSRCGGRLRLIALIDEAAVVDRILRPYGLLAEIPTPRPGRAPPLRLTPRQSPLGDATSVSRDSSNWRKPAHRAAMD